MNRSQQIIEIVEAHWTEAEGLVDPGNEFDANNAIPHIERAKHGDRASRNILKHYVKWRRAHDKHWDRFPDPITIEGAIAGEPYHKAGIKDYNKHVAPKLRKYFGKIRKQMDKEQPVWKQVQNA